MASGRTQFRQARLSQHSACRPRIDMSAGENSPGDDRRVGREIVELFTSCSLAGRSQSGASKVPAASVARFSGEPAVQAALAYTADGARPRKLSRAWSRWATATGASAHHRGGSIFSCASTSSQRWYAVLAAAKPQSQVAVCIPVHIGWSIVTRLIIGAVAPPFTLMTGTTIVFPLFL